MPRLVKKTFAQKQADQKAKLEEAALKERQAKHLKELKFLADCAQLDKELADLRVSERLSHEKARTDKLSNMTYEERSNFESAEEYYNEVGRYWYLNTM